jgi:hypothetical protein
MNRRDVLRGLAALPIATALGASENKLHKNRHSNELEIHLDGAFAVVIQENKSNSVLAFSPRPPKEEEHQFYFNGSRKPEASEKPYHFKLSPVGLAPVSKPEISPGLNDFSFKTERWRVGDSLVIIELPAPKRIAFSGHRSSVTFSDGRPAFMATNHILSYDLKDTKRPELECSDSSVRCDPSLDSFPGVTQVFFEIGPKRSLDFAESHAHAIKFFNYILRQSFPDLAEKFQLKEEYPAGPRKAHIIPKMIPAVLQSGNDDQRLRSASYVIDCEYGGLLGSTHTGPLQP